MPRLDTTRWQLPRWKHENFSLFQYFFFFFLIFSFGRKATRDWFIFRTFNNKVTWQSIDLCLLFRWSTYFSLARSAGQRIFSVSIPAISKCPSWTMNIRRSKVSTNRHRWSRTKICLSVLSSRRIWTKQPLWSVQINFLSCHQRPLCPSWANITWPEKI